ncbi:hypothetical protein PBRA_006129 [Plasmodiophora brassicae]|uniref:Cytoplasmic dynein 2 heavy chain 1 n=1 Tax=Plasmodiophora brassicae TaxID=37360 RepID=A0A0G4IRX0_PLABS|nr:hypothetical protein PBRA_006129 [Plasmodiophora brassicae]
MRVHYSERLVALLRDVRSLSELGYRIPADVQLAAETGDRFYRYAVQLQQVANFYNTMAAQILPSQKPMLLAEAHAFEAAVQSRAGATWDSPDQLEAYGLIDAQERTSAPPSMVMWRRHWDHQLFKALSVAYTAALANVPQPELKADLVWQQRALQLRPGIEDLRLAYVRHDWVAPGALDVQDQVDAILPAHAPVARFAANLDDEHWAALFHRLAFPKGVTLATLRLSHFLAAHVVVVEQTPALKELAGRAQGEVALREAFEEMRAWADQTEFELTGGADQGGGGVALIRGWKDVMTQAGDQQAMLASLRDSPYFAPFADLAAQIERRLTTLDGALHRLNGIQRRWVYLAPIFGRGALPNEQGRFARVDDDFRALMASIARNRNVMALTAMAGLDDRLASMADQLDRCQRALAEFLEAKRSLFPRFYFIGDDALLEILGQADNPAVIQSHLKKLFQGIDSVRFDGPAIVAMVSGDGEVVNLRAKVALSADVDEWLSRLADEMRKTLAGLLVDCVATTTTTAAVPPTMAWIDRFPSQILSLADQIRFTADVEQAIRASKGGSTSFASLRSARMARLADLTRAPAANAVQDLKVKALVIEMVHHVEVLEVLEREQVRDTNAWPWQKQLRFYLDEQTRQCVARMCSARFDYTYEYQGNAPRLVHTPLTDKCYLVLTQGMFLGYGGNPYGPAGTGKTESVKALGQALGRQVLVFNCDEGIDFQGMGRIFTGLVKSGAWGCFDEFNRLKEDQLSAVSQQIQVIQAALKGRQSHVDLLGAQINVDPNAGIFVTMNPAGKEYGGRSRLPDNLKALFRSVAMTAPDNVLIAEVVLYSEGFTHARMLGAKLVSVYDLARQLLSPQRHYDWGLRALKAVLRLAGQLFSRERHAQATAGSTRSEDVEKRLVVQALRASTLSKLAAADAGRFRALIGDLFPGTAVGDVDNADLARAIEAAAQARHLEVVPAQVRKALQLYDALSQRMGVVVVGPSGCGKSTLLAMLGDALGILGRPVRRIVLNPKSMERTALLGHMDVDTREWTDGVLTRAARQVVADPGTTFWIVCDGDVDPEWIESLNSVLDDNHLLTMPNGERLQFGSNVNFVFETADLEFASPATVSRMGMILVGDDDLDVRAIVASWLKRLPDDSVRRVAADSIDDLFYRAITQAPHAAVPCSTAGVVQAALSHVGDARSRVAFAVGLARGLGANMSTTDRRRLASEVFGWSGDRALHDAGGDPLHVTTDAGSSIRRFERIDGEVTLGAPVLTAELQANLATLTPWIRQGQPFVVVGPEGCGKSLLVRAALQQAGFAHATLHCSAQTRAVHVVQRLRDVCTTVQGASGRVLRPARGDRLVVFLKDINLARPDKYGTIELIALLTQIVTHGGFYDRVDNELEFVRVEGVIIGASLSQSAGRHALSLRFTSVVRILVVDYPSKADLEAICTSYLAPIVRAAASADSGRWGRPDAAHALAVTMTDFYATVRATFPADTNRHYVFTPRDLTGWAKALLRYDLSREHLLEVFANEACRTFRDRLVDRNAQERFDTMLAASLGERWGFKIDDPPLSCFSSLLSGTPSSDGGSGPSDIGPVLQRVTMTDLQALVSDGLRSYEREYRPLDIVMFPEMLMALANTDRVLSAPGGSILCVGPSGVGRRSILQLLCHMRSLHLFTPPVSRSYTARQFDGDLKDLMRRAGVDGEHVVLLLQEHQLVHAHMLESVNSLLSSGQIPGLYTGAEFDAVLQSGGLRELAAAQATPVPVADLFAQRVLRNLHIALLMDPQHPEFVSRLTSNPALLHRCTILWRATWTNAAIRALLQARLRHVLLETRPGQRGDDDDADGLVDANHPVVQRLIAMHDWAGTRSAPQKLIALVDTYTQVLASERGRLQGKRRFLALGLDKLREAESLVATLSGEAVQKQRALQAKQVEADAALQSISESMSAASERRLEVQALQSTLGDKEERLRARKVEVEKELSEIAPVLDASREAVGSIRKEALAEMRALRMPPEAVHDVLSGVLMFMGNDDVSWNSMKRLLASATFKEEIVNFDARRASRETREKVKALLAKKESSFDHKTIYRVNVAAAPLAAWVQANVRYADVLERIAPLEADLNAANAALASSRSRLQACVEELQKLDSSVQTLKGAFARTTSEAEALRLGLQSAQEILNRAQSLLGQLGDEKARWTRDHGRLDALLNDLPSQVVTAAAFIAYLGGRPEDDRRLALESWKSERGAEPFSLPRFLSTASETISWKEQGLSGDALSVENAIVIVRSRQTPFVIDPARQAERWLESRLHAEHRPVEVLVNNDPRFSSVLELSVRFGKSLVIKDVDGIEPALYPLLRRDLVRQGPRWVVPVGDKLVDFSDDFALYLVTRRTDIQLTPTDEANVNVVNFTVTFSGLQSQLLSTTLAQEEPELEKKKTDLLRQEDCLHVQLADLERKLLEELATSEGNILENKTLAESLQASKARSTEIQTGLENARQIQASLDSQRMAYQPIADTGARLFFLVDVLYHTNPMYRFSLNSFIAEFLANITDQAKALSASDKAERIARFSRGLIGRVYRVIAQSLFKDDRLTFAMHLARGLRPDLIDDQSWSFLIGVTAGPTRPGTSRPPTWLPADRHAAYASLAQAFPDMITSLSGVDVGAWQSWVASPRCENDLPPALSKALNPAQRLLVLAAVRPDRLHSAMVSFACNALGLPTASPSTATLNELLRSPSPVLFVTSPGADPTRDIEELAESSGVPLVQIAMGQGQTDAALKAISTASSNGSWVCLKNLHLVSTWLPTLEKALGALSKCHERYRLWLTSESHACWPAMLLQRATKVTVEAPPGVKRNLLSTYSMWNDDFVGKGNDTTRARLLFCLAWFHALVQERRIYIPQGWTKFYEFSLADLRAGADIIDGICSGRSAPSPVPWPTIYGLMQDAVYGGRIDNAFDCRVLRAYIENIFRDDVDLGPSVRIPSSAAHGDFLRVIRSLPDTDSPLVFGLPENVEGSVQRQRSAAVLGQLKTLHHALVSAAHADRYDRDAWRALLSPVMTLWRSSPRNGPTYGADTPPGDDASPLVNFLNLEKCRVTNLAGVIDSSLGALYDLVWSGTGIRTSQIEADARALMKGSVPSSWSSIWASGPENASAFVSEVISRQPALASWADRLSSNSLLSAPLRLAHLFHPAAFLNAFRQETARQLQLSIDSLRIVCALDRTRLPRAASPVMQVEGLLLQGAAFTNGQLSSLSAQSPLLQALPLCYIAFVDAAQPDPYNDAVQLPLYESTTRDKVVSELKLPCSGDARQWILAGAAIFLTDTSV